jgi:ribose transport system permease protein
MNPTTTAESPASGVAAPPSGSNGARAKSAAGAMLGRGHLLSRWGVIATYLLMLVIFTIARPETFPTVSNFRGMINQTPVMILFACAVSLVLLCGEFDISFPYFTDLATVVLAVIVSGGALAGGQSVAVAIVAALLLTAVAGVANGLLVAKLGVSSFVTSLVTGFVAGGITLALQGYLPDGAVQLSVVQMPDALQTLGTGEIPGLGLQWPVLIAVVAALVAWFVLRRTVSGRRLHAIGGNARAAELAGVPVARLRIYAFVAVGLFAGIAGIINAGQIGYINGISPPLLLQSYTAAFLGAAVLGYRRFHIGGAVFAVIFLATLANGLSLMGQPAWIVSVISGAVLLVAVLTSRVRQR